MDNHHTIVLVGLFSLILVLSGCESESATSQMRPSEAYLFGTGKDENIFLADLPSSPAEMSLFVSKLEKDGLNKRGGLSHLEAVPHALFELACKGNTSAAGKLFWYATLDAAMGEGGIGYVEEFAKREPCIFLEAFGVKREIAEQALKAEMISPSSFENFSRPLDCGLKNERALRMAILKLTSATP